MATDNSLDHRLASAMRPDRIPAAMDYLRMGNIESALRTLDSGDLTSAQIIAAAQIVGNVEPDYILAHLRSLEMRRHFGDQSDAHLAAERDRETLLREITAQLQ